MHSIRRVGVLLVVLLSGCGAQPSSVNVPFPSAPKERALHCHTVLTVHLQRMTEMTGSNSVAKRLRQDYVNAQRAAATSLDVNELLKPIDVQTERMMKTVDAFENDGPAWGQRVELCTETYGPKQ